MSMYIYICMYVCIFSRFYLEFSGQAEYVHILSRFYLECSRNASGVCMYVCMHKVKERYVQSKRKVRKYA
jgi:hypothetical protein